MSFFRVVSTLTFVFIFATSTCAAAASSPDAATHLFAKRQLSGVGTKTEKTCAGIKIDDRVTGCTGTPWTYSKAKPRITAKTAVPVKMLQGRAAGIADTCDMLVPATWLMEVFMDNTVCDEMLQVTTSALSKMEAALKKQLSAAGNKQSLQKARVSEIKKAIFSGDFAKSRRYGELERAATMDFLLKQKTAAMATAKQIDTTVKGSLKVPGGIEAALGKLYTQIQGENTLLQAQIMQKVKRLQQQAKQAQTNAANCAKGGAAPGKKVAARLVRSFSLISSHPTSLERAATVPRAPRSGPRAPPAPKCPAKSAPPKKVVPRSQVKTKPAPAKKPRQPRAQPKPKAPSPNKRVAKRPANRPRRQPGKAAPQKRTTPKRKPKVVPKPTRKPKGKARPRRRGRK